MAFFSRKLHGAKLNYPTHDLEMLAVIEGLKEFEHHLLGRDFGILTDHYELQYIRAQKHLNCRQQKWIGLMTELGYREPGRLCIPLGLKAKLSILERLHDDPLSAHFRNHQDKTSSTTPIILAQNEGGHHLTHPDV